MAAVNEWITREYFESLGFLVQQPTKYTVSARRKASAEEFDLLVYNPLTREPAISTDLLWHSSDLAGVQRGVVAVRGWHTDRVGPATLKISPEILNFTREPALEEVRRALGEGPVAKILVLPELPANRDSEQETLDICRRSGVDGVILFRTMLLELSRQVDSNKNYDKSDLLQILRILKNYDLLKDAQLDLFGKKKPRGKVAGDKKEAALPDGPVLSDASDPSDASDGSGPIPDHPETGP